MKRLLIISLSVLLLCGILGGCRSTAGGQQSSDLPDTIETTAAPRETTQKETLPVETYPQVTGSPLNPTAPILPVETIPKSTDDSDYQLPPGERPTPTPEIK